MTSLPDTTDTDTLAEPTLSEIEQQYALAAENIHQHVKELVKSWMDFRGHEFSFREIIRKAIPRPAPSAEPSIDRYTVERCAEKLQTIMGEVHQKLGEELAKSGNSISSNWQGGHWNGLATAQAAISSLLTDAPPTTCTCGQSGHGNAHDPSCPRSGHSGPVKSERQEALHAKLAQANSPAQSSPPAGDGIRITLARREDGGLRVYSDQVAGLILSHSDPNKVMAMILPALQALNAYADAPFPPAGEGEIEAMAEAMYEAGREWYPDKPKWSELSSLSSSQNPDHYRVMAHAALAALRRAHAQPEEKP